jgi:hypothetical protein
MGLREKQLVRFYIEEYLPKLDQEIYDVTGGGKVEWEVDWDSFLPSEEALKYVENMGFYLVYNALRAISYNDFGKKAVREGVKKVIVKRVTDAKQVMTKFENGTLYFYGAWPDAWKSEDDIRRVVEDGL